MAAFSICLSELDLGFLAGFFEGEATFTIGEQNGGQSYSCGVRLKLRDDDQDGGRPRVLDASARDDRPLLELLGSVPRAGRVYDTRRRPR